MRTHADARRASRTIDHDMISAHDAAAPRMLALLACLVLAACGGGPRVLPVNNDADGRAPTDAERLFVSTIASRVEGIRGLRFEEPIQLGVITEGAMIARARRRIRHPGTPSRHSRRVALGLVSERVTQTEEAFYRSGVFSHFDPRCACIQILEEPLARALAGGHVGAESHLAHELTHDLAASHFPQPVWMRASRNNDGRRVIQMVHEGDAQLVQALYIARMRQADEGMTVDRILEHDLSVMTRRASFRHASAYIRQLRHGNYFFGLAFVRAVWEREGWDGVNQLYRSPPPSTEQVLHPELYFRHHAPLRVGAPRSITLERAGYQAHGEHTFGELETAVWFGRPTDDFDLTAAAGWGGDNSIVYVSPADEPASLWISKWDTERDAMEAERAARRVLEHRGAAESSSVTRRRLTLLVVQDVPPELHAQVVADVLGPP